jgi:cytochrome P450
LLGGNAAQLGRDRLGFMLHCARTYGDLVPLRIGPRRAFLLSHPDYIAEVLVNQQHAFIRPYPVRQSRVTFGDSMFVTSGPPWRRQRRLAQPAFHHDRIAAYGEAMVAQAERMLAGWRHGQRRDIHRDMSDVTLAVVSRTLFDADVQDEAAVVGQAMRVVMERFTARMDSALPLPERLPTPGNLRLRAAVRQLDRTIYRVIDQARSPNSERSGRRAVHLLALLLAARDEDGGRMSDREVRDEAMAFFLAGHETTALVLTWTFHLLAQHPRVRSRLEAELWDVLGGRPPQVEDVPSLVLTERVLWESMRLYPPAYAFARDSVADAQVDGWRIPKHSTVIMSQWVVHRDRRWFHRPEAFDPDRWAGDLVKQLPRFAYFPFGGGPHKCIGAGFASLEATLLLATIAQRFRLDAMPEHPVELLPQITLRPRSGVQMRLTARTGREAPTAARGER